VAQFWLAQVAQFWLAVKHEDIADHLLSVAYIMRYAEYLLLRKDVLEIRYILIFLNIFHSMRDRKYSLSS